MTMQTRNLEELRRRIGEVRGYHPVQIAIALAKSVNGSKKIDIIGVNVRPLSEGVC